MTLRIMVDGTAILLATDIMYCIEMGTLGDPCAGMHKSFTAQYRGSDLIKYFGVKCYSILELTNRKALESRL